MLSIMKTLHLSKKNKKIAGVCGGIGEWIEVDPIAIRLLVVFIALVTAVIPACITYAIAWAIIPPAK